MPDEPQAVICVHLSDLKPVQPSTLKGCEDCLKIHARWVHLRLCLECGHVGCCDSSPNKHATAHYHHSHHALIQSFEPGEDWAWCYIDEAFIEPAPLQEARR